MQLGQRKWATIWKSPVWLWWIAAFYFSKSAWRPPVAASRQQLCSHTTSLLALYFVSWPNHSAGTAVFLDSDTFHFFTVWNDIVDEFISQRRGHFLYNCYNQRCFSVRRWFSKETPTSCRVLNCFAQTAESSFCRRTMQSVSSVSCCFLFEGPCQRLFHYDSHLTDARKVQPSGKLNHQR